MGKRGNSKLDRQVSNQVGINYFTYRSLARRVNERYNLPTASGGQVDGVVPLFFRDDSRASAIFVTTRVARDKPDNATLFDISFQPIKAKDITYQPYL